MLVPLLNKFWIKEMSANKSFNVLPHTNIPAYFSVNLSCSSYTLHVCRVHWLVARMAGDERIKYYFPMKSIALGCKVRYGLLRGNYLDIPGCTSTSKIRKNPTNFGFRITCNFFIIFFLSSYSWASNNYSLQCLPWISWNINLEMWSYVKQCSTKYNHFNSRHLSALEISALEKTLRTGRKEFDIVWVTGYCD